MDRTLLIAGLGLLGFAIACGVMAASSYRDPIGVGLLMFWAFIAGVVLSTALLGEQAPTTKSVTGEDAKPQDE